MSITFFRSPTALRKWLERHHDTARELWVGFYKKESGRGGITYPEALEQALCFGWIDGLRKRVDAISYAQRFSPRTPRTSWSAINIRRAGELAARGLMTPAGLASFEVHETKPPTRAEHPTRLPAAYEKSFRTNETAWRYFAAQAPSYQRMAIRWVLTAVKDETRLRRLAVLIGDSASERRLGPR